jgi:hypothetical protein
MRDLIKDFLHIFWVSVENVQFYFAENKMYFYTL